MNMPTPANADHEALAEDAAHWCMRIHAEDCTPQEREGFQRWLAADPEHAREFVAMLEIWEASEWLAPQLAEAARPVAAAPTPPTRRTRRAWSRRSIAAAFALLVLPASAYLGWSMGWLPDDYRRYRTDSVLHDVALPDGSYTSLNLNTHLTFANFKDRRRVSLDRGEAYFEVSHDASHPFVVEAGTGSITVTGTRFNVWTYGDDVVVTVTEGSVKVNSDRRQEQSSGLTAGMQARYGSGDVQPQIGSANATQALAWRSGKLILDDLTLAQALPLINRYRQRPLQLADGTLGTLRVGGIYNSRNVDALVDALPKVLPVRLIHREDGTTLLARR